MKQAAQANGELQKALKAGVVADAVALAKAASAAFADIEKSLRSRPEEGRCGEACGFGARGFLPMRRPPQRRATSWQRRWLPVTQPRTASSATGFRTARVIRRPASSSRPALSTSRSTVITE